MSKSKPPAAQIRAQTKLVMAQGAAEGAVAILQTIHLLVEGHEYRMRIREMVQSLQADQSMRHADVEYLSTVLDRHGSDMTASTRDQFHLAMLRLLDVTGLSGKLPAL